MTALTTKIHLQVLEAGEKPVGPSPVFIEVDKDVCFNTNVMEALAINGCLPVHYDLLLACAAIEFADRHWRRTTDWHRYLHITMPVIELEKWQSPEVKSSLLRVLRYLTGDTWSFSFVQAKNLEPCKFRQLHFDVGELKSFAMAYSEGLDSRAVASLSGTENEALCVRVANKHQEPRHGDSFFTQIPFTVRNRGGRESSFRSRGFQFAALTSIVAHIRRISRIVVPESGQGALGPAMLPLHRLYADYRNHPTYFRIMEIFIAELLEHQVSFEQPRLWSTKGQTLSAFLQLPGKTRAELIDTRSCWQTRHVVNLGGARRQCGLCAACLLRRFSFFAAGIVEPVETYVIRNLRVPDVYEAMDDINDPNDQDNMIEYGIAGARHFQHMANMANWNDDDLWMFAFEISEATTLSVSETLTKLKKLLTQHAQEWKTFLAAQGDKSFLHNWVSGGNHGRFE